jgi:DNA polymerase III subunit epsilon
MNQLLVSVRKVIGRHTGIWGDVELIQRPDAIIITCLQKQVAAPIKIDPNTKLKDLEFVVFDIETTGLHPYGGDKVIALSGVKIEEGSLREELYFDELINPGIPIPPITTEITGIANYMVKNKPCLLDSLNDFLTFVGNRVLVAHNSNFDLNFINAYLKKYCGVKLNHPVLDSMVIANALFPTEKSHTLDALAIKFNISPSNRHTSLGDSIITARLFIHLMDILEDRGIITLRDLANYLHWRNYR